MGVVLLHMLHNVYARPLPREGYKHYNLLPRQHQMWKKDMSNIKALYVGMVTSYIFTSRPSCPETNFGLGSNLFQSLCHIGRSIDGFQMSIKHPISGGQMCDQEAAMYSGPFNLSVLMART